MSRLRLAPRRLSDARLIAAANGDTASFIDFEKSDQSLTLVRTFFQIDQ
jgi:hypothetical protein